MVVCCIGDVFRACNVKSEAGPPDPRHRRPSLGLEYPHFFRILQSDAEPVNASVESTIPRLLIRIRHIRLANLRTNRTFGFLRPWRRSAVQRNSFERDYDF